MISARFESALALHSPAAYKQGKDIPAAQLPELFRKLFTAICGEQEKAIEVLHVQITELQQFISAAHEEIAAIRPGSMQNIEIPEAQDELSAVVSATEEATNIILDSVEGLESLSASFTGECAEKWQSLIVRIYEASNFQDITGQRIAKVVNTLRGIESRVQKLTAFFPGEDAATSDVTGDMGLLNGPQLPEKAVTQDDIDALFE